MERDLAHVWQDIVRENPGDFNEDHMHVYWPGQGYKLCVLELRVPALVIAYVQARLNEPGKVAKSVTAMDGSAGWDEVCEGTNAQAIYTPSDRQVILANNDMV